MADPLRHPLRQRLLRLLQTSGPSTATKLAAATGETSGLTSYHLRELAKAGLVTEVGHAGRERWWQAAQDAPAARPARPRRAPADSGVRSEILAAAGTLLAELDGAQGLSMRAVARAVGIAPASIYHHFADKDALIAGLAEYESERMAAVMARARDSRSADDPIGRFAAQIDVYCRFALTNPGHYRLLLNEQPKTGQDGYLEGPIVRLVVELINALDRCAAAGHALRLPSRRAAFMAFVASHGRVALWHAFPDEGRVEQIEPFVAEVVSLVIS
ncbi:MAG TPA: helix-turn-helix domain-containing protein [Pseudonocardiaceae bacterium]|nr:helix-turn-helix domain-containing protein [Pseudonocardiaceae bacterium]